MSFGTEVAFGRGYLGLIGKEVESSKERIAITEDNDGERRPQDNECD